MTPDDPRHGTVNGYSNCQCRCSECRASWSAYVLDYRARHPEQVEKAKVRRKARRAEAREAKTSA